MNSRNRQENRADVMRVLLAVSVLALLSLLDNSPAPQVSAAASSVAAIRWLGG
jgi:hypothetical protein